MKKIPSVKFCLWCNAVVAAAPLLTLAICLGLWIATLIVYSVATDFTHRPENSIDAVFSVISALTSGGAAVSLIEVCRSSTLDKYYDSDYWGTEFPVLKFKYVEEEITTFPLSSDLRRIIDAMHHGLDDDHSTFRTHAGWINNLRWHLREATKITPISKMPPRLQLYFKQVEAISNIRKNY